MRPEGLSGLASHAGSAFVTERAAARDPARRTYAAVAMASGFNDAGRDAAAREWKANLPNGTLAAWRPPELGLVLRRCRPTATLGSNLFDLFQDLHQGEILSLA